MPGFIYADFAQLLQRAKTDATRVQTLAQSAATLQPPLWTPPPAVYHQLQQCLAERDRLLDLQQQLRNQLHALSQYPCVVESVRERMNTLLSTLSEQIQQVDSDLALALLEDCQWASSAELLLSIKDIGPITAGWLLVSTLNFTACASAEAMVAYAGLAPNPRQSGTSVRGRASIGHGGNGRLRTAMYFATLSAGRLNPLIKDFYERLRSAGKPMKVARCAAARKLLHIAWGSLRQRPWAVRKNTKFTQESLDFQYRIFRSTTPYWPAQWRVWLPSVRVWVCAERASWGWSPLGVGQYLTFDESCQQS